LLLLAGWEGLAVSEIAEVLGVPGAVVSRRLHRARTRLAQLLRAAEAETAGDRDGSGHVPCEPAPKSEAS
jgi:RNA polymerase sigma-70 factor (ECF subfamily)